MDAYVMKTNVTNGEQPAIRRGKSGPKKSKIAKKKKVPKKGLGIEALERIRVHEELYGVGASSSGSVWNEVNKHLIFHDQPAGVANHKRPSNQENGNVIMEDESSLDLSLSLKLPY